MKSFLIVRRLFASYACCLALLPILTCCLPLAAQAEGPIPAQNVAVDLFFSPDPAIEGAISGFDLDQNGNLHFSMGDPDWELKCDVYRHTKAGETMLVYSSDDVFAGSVAVIGSKVYFNDGGDYMRGDYNFFLYDAAQPSAVHEVLIAPYGASLGGVAKRHDAELFGVGAEFTWGPAAFFHSALDRSGFLEDDTLQKIGEVGETPGPMTFDHRGNLYYAHGYVFSGVAGLFRWTADDVDAAITAPLDRPLLPDDAQWTALPEGYGATGMATDEAGNVFLTATAWLEPSYLLAYRADDAAEVSVLAYEDRLGTVRHRDGVLYVNSADSIFRIPLLQTLSQLSPEETNLQARPGETVVLALNPDCGIGEKHYQWRRVNEDKSHVPVGDNMPHYAFTATIEDAGAVFYCVVSDALSTVESTYFTVDVQMPVPATAPWALFFTGSLLLLLGMGFMIRYSRQCREGA